MLFNPIHYCSDTLTYGLCCGCKFVGRLS